MKTQHLHKIPLIYQLKTKTYKLKNILTYIYSIIFFIAVSSISSVLPAQYLYPGGYDLH